MESLVNSRVKAVQDKINAMSQGMGTLGNPTQTLGHLNDLENRFARTTTAANSFGRAIDRIAGTLTGGLGIGIAVGGLALLEKGFEKAIDKARQFQTAQLSIAAVLASSYRYQSNGYQFTGPQSYQVATRQSQALNQDLLKRSANSILTYQELQQSFLVGLAGGANKRGLNPTQTLDIVNKLAVAAKAFGASGQRISQNVREIMSGSPRLGQGVLGSTLNIHAADFKDKKGQEFIDFFDNKLKGFNFAAEDYKKSISAQLTNLETGIDKFAARVGTRFMANSGPTIKRFTDAFSGPGSDHAVDIAAKGFENIVKAINAIASSPALPIFEKLMDILASNADKLVLISALSRLGSILGGIQAGVGRLTGEMTGLSAASTKAATSMGEVAVEGKAISMATGGVDRGFLGGATSGPGGVGGAAWREMTVFSAADSRRAALRKTLYMRNLGERTGPIPFADWYRNGQSSNFVNAGLNRRAREAVVRGMVSNDAYEASFNDNLMMSNRNNIAGEADFQSYAGRMGSLSSEGRHLPPGIGSPFAGMSPWYVAGGAGADAWSLAKSAGGNGLMGYLYGTIGGGIAQSALKNTALSGVGNFAGDQGGNIVGGLMLMAALKKGLASQAGMGRMLPKLLGMNYGFTPGSMIPEGSVLANEGTGLSGMVGEGGMMATGGEMALGTGTLAAVGIPAALGAIISAPLINAASQGITGHDVIGTWLAHATGYAGNGEATTSAKQTDPKMLAAGQRYAMLQRAIAHIKGLGAGASQRQIAALPNLIHEANMLHALANPDMVANGETKDDATEQMKRLQAAQTWSGHLHGLDNTLYNLDVKRQIENLNIDKAAEDGQLPVNDADKNRALMLTFGANKNGKTFAENSQVAASGRFKANSLADFNLSSRFARDNVASLREEGSSNLFAASQSRKRREGMTEILKDALELPEGDREAFIKGRTANLNLGLSDDAQRRNNARRIMQAKLNPDRIGSEYQTGRLGLENTLIEGRGNFDKQSDYEADKRKQLADYDKKFNMPLKRLEAQVEALKLGTDPESVTSALKKAFQVTAAKLKELQEAGDITAGDASRLRLDAADTLKGNLNKNAWDESHNLLGPNGQRAQTEANIYRYSQFQRGQSALAEARGNSPLAGYHNLLADLAEKRETHMFTDDQFQQYKNDSIKTYRDELSKSQRNLNLEIAQTNQETQKSVADHQMDLASRGWEDQGRTMGRDRAELANKRAHEDYDQSGIAQSREAAARAAAIPGLERSLRAAQIAPTLESGNGVYSPVASAIRMGIDAQDGFNPSAYAKAYRESKRLHKADQQATIQNAQNAIDQAQQPVNGLAGARALQDLALSDADLAHAKEGYGLEDQKVKQGRGDADAAFGLGQQANANKLADLNKDRNRNIDALNALDNGGRTIAGLTPGSGNSPSGGTVNVSPTVNANFYLNLDPAKINMNELWDKLKPVVVADLERAQKRTK